MGRSRKPGVRKAHAKAALSAGKGMGKTAITSGIWPSLAASFMGVFAVAVGVMGLAIWPVITVLSLVGKTITGVSSRKRMRRVQAKLEFIEALDEAIEEQLRRR